MQGNLKPIKNDRRRLDEHNQRYIWKRANDATRAHRHRRRTMRARLRRLIGARSERYRRPHTGQLARERKLPRPYKAARAASYPP